MGEEAAPNEPGNLCNVCWGVGGPWFGSDTPKFVNVSITGVVLSAAPACAFLPSDCDPINIACEQEVGSPCIWKGQRNSEKPGLPFMVAFILTGVSSVLECRVAGLWLVFVHNIGSTCQVSFTNQNTPPACYTGGGGSVT